MTFEPDAKHLETVGKLLQKLRTRTTSREALDLSRQVLQEVEAISQDSGGGKPSGRRDRLAFGSGVPLATVQQVPEEVANSLTTALDSIGVAKHQLDKIEALLREMIASLGRWK